jgi:pimeloyl-ACP methyl ester carboxylesterase
LPPCARARTLDTERGPFAVHEAQPAIEATASVVLVPGFTGSKEDFITVLEPLAAAGYHVLAMDQRGQFETPGPDDDAAYSLDALGADLLAVAATTGAAVHLVGHSFGGLVVRAATIAEPAAVRTATLLCSGPGVITVEREAERIQMLIGALGVLSVADIWTYVHAGAATNHEYDGVAADVQDFLARRFLTTTKAGLRTMATTLTDTPDRTADLAATGVPVLVAYGADDYIWLPAEQADMAARLGAAHAVIPGAAHSPAVQEPAGTVALLTRFWADPTSIVHEA